MNAISTYMNGVADRARFNLVEMTTLSGIQIFLAPANLLHCEIQTEPEEEKRAVLITVNSEMHISISEWDRIKSKFGYSDPHIPSFTNLISATPSKGEIDTE